MKIGHASQDENKHIKNGQAGDQTGKEVYIREWYANGWNYVLRCKDSSIAEKMAISCEKGCDNNNIGYDQNQRNTLRTEAQKVGFDLSKITTPCETDCSAFMTVCAESAGVAIPYNGNNAPTTSTMKAAFTKTGLFDVLTDKKYTSSDKYLKRGDILVKSGHHTVMVLENGKTELPTLKIGSKGEYVKAVQKYLSAIGFQVGEIDGIFGSQTAGCVRGYQKYKGLEIDGIWGKECWASIGM